MVHWLNPSLQKSDFPAAGRQGRHQFSSPQSDAFTAVCPLVFENELLPLLQQRGDAEPVQRVLKNNDVMPVQQGLLAFDIDVKIGIQFVQVMEGNSIKVLDGIHQLLIDP